MINNRKFNRKTYNGGIPAKIGLNEKGTKILVIMIYIDSRRKDQPVPDSLEGYLVLKALKGVDAEKPHIIHKDYGHFNNCLNSLS